MRTAAICPTCATYENAVCVIYNGPTLSNINVPPLTDLQTALGSIDSSIGSVIALINAVAANPIFLTTDGTSNLATLSGNVLNIPTYEPTLQDVTTYGNTTDQDIIITNGSGTSSLTLRPNNLELKNITTNRYTYFIHTQLYIYDQNSGGTSTIIFPDPDDNATFNFQSVGGTLALTTDCTLQSITSGTNKDLIDGINLQGTGAGDNNTGTQDINAFGLDAAKNNTGALINALGRRAAKDNTGANVNALGNDSANNNSGSFVNGIGSISLINNSGDYVNAMGPSAGANNTFSYVNLLGYGASASANNQLALSKDMGSQMARIGYGGITADRLYALPDASGTFALTNTAWSLTGNASTNPSTDFIGTTDNQDVVFKRNSTEYLRFKTTGANDDVYFSKNIKLQGTTPQIWLNGSLGYSVISTDSTGGFITLNNNNSHSATIKAANLTTGRTLQLPDANGELVVSVNGVTPVNGNVTVSASLPYLVYSAIVTFAAGQLQVVQQLQNTTGRTFTFATFGTISEITASSSLFTANKTVFIGNSFVGSAVYNVIGGYFSATILNVVAYDTNTQLPAIDNGYPFFIEIRIYP